MYAQVADVMRKRIVKDLWGVGDKIPTLPELAQEFDVATVTVRQAVHLLTKEGLLLPRQGLGTYVVNKPEIHPRMRVETSLSSLADLYRQLSPHVTPLEEGDAKPKLEANEGKLAPKYRYLRRMHSSDRQVTSVIDAYIDERVFQLAPQRFRKELIIPILVDLAQVRIGTAKQILTVSSAGADIAKLMNVSTFAPVAEVRRVFCDPNGTVIYIGELIYRADFIRVDIDLMA